MNSSSAINPSAWNELAITINQLLLEDPEKGLFTIFVTVIVFLLLVLITVWAVTRIIKANKSLPPPSGETFNRDQFTLNVLTLTERMTKLTVEGRNLAAKHERILEHTITRDQMTVVDNSLENLKSIITISFNDKLREISPHFSGTVGEFPAARIFEHSLNYTFEEVIKFFRRIAKENHLADRSEKDFNDYINQKLEAIKNHGRKVFESVYASDIIPISHILKKYEERWPSYAEELRHLLESMREISIVYRDQIKREEEEYQTRWTAFTSSIHDTLSKGITK